MLLRLLKYLGKIILLVVTLLFLVVVIEYLLCPVYKFNEPHPFAGYRIYNPYQNVDLKKKYKANFQVQSYAWLGLTAGRKNSNEAIYQVYKSQWYDIIATSDYQKINQNRAGEPGYVAVYEHGYGIRKSHQILIGARNVLWTDYPIFQTIHHKQHILNLLRNGSNLTYIAHPRFRHGYDPEDMKYLSNYDGIEVLNNYRTSPAHWDSALSAGNYVTILGDDDAHDISNPDEIGHHCTFIFSDGISQAEIIDALRNGRAYGAMIPRPLGETFEEKRSRTRILPQISTINVWNDSLEIETDSVANEIRFIGQGGSLLEKVTGIKTAYYRIKPDDTYIRTEIEFTQGIIYYLNPICRMDKNTPAKTPCPAIDKRRTIIQMIVGFSTLLFVLVNGFVLRKRIRSRRTL